MDIKKLKLQVEREIASLISKVANIPYELIPKVNEPNDLAYPFIDISSEGDLYYVVRERGVELERSIHPDVDCLLNKIFIDLSFVLASKKEMEEREIEADYSFDKIKNIQKEYLKKFNPDWNL